MLFKQFLPQKGFGPATLAQRFVVKPPPARRSGSVAGVTGACVCDCWVEYIEVEQDRDDFRENLIYLCEHKLITGTLINGKVELIRPGTQPQG